MRWGMSWPTGRGRRVFFYAGPLTWAVLFWVWAAAWCVFSVLFVAWVAARGVWWLLTYPARRAAPRRDDVKLPRLV